MHLYAYFEDEAEPGHRNPAFATDVFPHHSQEDLDRLRRSCEEAASEWPHFTYVVVDLDHETDPDDPIDSGGVVDVFGLLLREQEEDRSSDTAATGPARANQTTDTRRCP